MTGPRRVTPSRINNRRRCKRRAWYDAHRPRGEPNIYAAFGDATHLHLEAYLEHGTPPPLTEPEGECAFSGLANLPLPGEALVEQKFSFDYDGLMYRGRIDFLTGHVPGLMIVVGDHKTIGDLKRRKTPEQLVDDPQRIVYSYWAAKMFGVSHVTTHWIYYRRKRPKAESVSFTSDVSEINERFARLHIEEGKPSADEIDLPTPDSLPRDLTACFLFPPEGCPYRGECQEGLTPLDLATAIMFKDTP